MAGGSTADPMVTQSCPGSICPCGVCQPSFLSVLPCLFKSGTQAVAQITNSNNAVKVATLNANAGIQKAQISAASAPTMYLVIAAAVIVVVIFAFKK
jgi:hypothetical protein